jgi:hypothetical protein
MRLNGLTVVLIGVVAHFGHSLQFLHGRVRALTLVKSTTTSTTTITTTSTSEAGEVITTTVTTTTTSSAQRQPNIQPNWLQSESKSSDYVSPNNLKIPSAPPAEAPPETASFLAMMSTMQVQDKDDDYAAFGSVEEELEAFGGDPWFAESTLKSLKPNIKPKQAPQSTPSDSAATSKRVRVEDVRLFKKLGSDDERVMDLEDEVHAYYLNYYFDFLFICLRIYVSSPSIPSPNLHVFQLMMNGGDPWFLGNDDSLLTSST